MEEVAIISLVNPLWLMGVDALITKKYILKY
jgi:hypothetical protein